MTFTQNQILKTAISQNGEDTQLTVAVEELSELIKEICKHRRGEDNHLSIAEEMADVYIILRELEIIFNNSDIVEKQIDFKINRLERRLHK